MFQASKPNPEPALPAAFDVFTPPGTLSSPLPCAPVISNESKILEANHAVALCGENLGFAWEYDQTSAGNGQWLTLTALSNSTENWILNVPAAANNNSAHLLWAASSAGGPLSAPVMPNAAQAWWVQGVGNAGGAVAAGDSIGVFGANLWYAGVTPEVVVTDSGVRSTVCALTAWNPYKITFTVPAVAAGTHQVWVHNGHGGEYGWAGPLTLTTGAALAFNGGLFNCKTSFGCYGDGIHDDTAAITATVAAAEGAGFGVAYFPAGNYLFSKGLTANKVEVLGDGPGLTTFQGVTNYAGDSFFRSTNGSCSYVLLSGFACTAYSVSSSVITYDSAIAFACNNFSMQDLSVTVGMNLFDNSTMVALSMYGSNTISEYATVNNCWLAANRSLANFGDYSVISNNQFLCNYDGGGGGAQSQSGLDYENNQLLDFNPGDPAHNGNTDGRLIDEIVGGNRDVYIAGNSSLGTGPTQYAANQNAGEWIMCEGATGGTQVTITAATQNSVTIPGDAASAYGDGLWICEIVGGPGFGQYAEITADAAGLLSLARPFNEVPVAGQSFAVVIQANENWAVYGNTKVGNGRVASTAGVEFYGSMLNGWVQANAISGVAQAVYAMTLVYGGPQVGSVGFNYFLGNTFSSELTQGVYDAVQFADSPATKEGVYNMDNIFYDNAITLPAVCAFNLAVSDLSGGLGSTNAVAVDGTLVMGNTGSLSGAAQGLQNNAGAVRQVNLVDQNNFWDP
jgi:hypothetical protein